MMKNHRICIYPKDVSLILGKSVQQARRILSVIKDAYGKDQKQYISIAEFALYTGLDQEEVKSMCK